MQIWIRASRLDDDCDRRAAVHQWGKSFNLPLRKLGNRIGSTVGTHAHKVFEAQAAFKAATGAMPNFRHGLKEATESLFKACDEGMEYDPKGTTDRAKAAVQLEDIARTFNAEYLPYHNTGLVNVEGAPVKFVEKELALWWDKDHQVMVTARADHGTTAGGMHDYKTGARKPNQPLQAGLQAIIAKPHGFEAKSVASIWIPRSTAKLEIIEYPINAVIEETKARVDGLIKSFREYEKERSILVFTPNPNSHSCKAAYCAAYGTPACPLMEDKPVE
jgi:hypothetical protein